MKITRRTEAGFVSRAFLELVLAAAALVAVGVVIEGVWSARWGVVAGVVGAVAALWLTGFMVGRLTRLKPGDGVKVQFGPHAGACGRVIGPLPDGQGVQVALIVDGLERVVDFHGGYQLVRLKQSRNPWADASKTHEDQRIGKLP